MQTAVEFIMIAAGALSVAIWVGQVAVYTAAFVAYRKYVLFTGGLNAGKVQKAI